MALNLLGSNFGNQNYTPAQSGSLTGLFKRYNKPISTSRTISGKPITKSYTKRITLPEKQRMTYAEANIPDPVGFETARVPLKSVFTSKRSERREYVSSVKKYNEEATAFNTEIEKAKKQVDVYNKEVDEWNTKGRFQEITTTYTETPTYKSTITFDVPKEENKKFMFTSQTQTKSSANNFFTNIKLNPAGMPVSSMYNYSFEKKPTYFSELKRQTVERYIEPFKYIGGSITKGFGIIGTSIKSGDWTEFKEARKQSSKDLRAGVTVAFSKLKGGVKTAIATQPFRKGFGREVYAETRRFREDLKKPQRQAELTLIAGETLLSYGIFKASQPKIIQEPTIKSTIKIIETPKKLKTATLDKFVSITKYRSTTPEIQSTWFGLKKTKINYSGEILSYTPKSKGIINSGNFFRGTTSGNLNRISTSLKYLEAPIKSDLPTVISPPKSNIFKDTIFKISEKISGLPKLNQDINPIFEVYKGKISYTIGKKTITENIDDLGLLLRKQEYTLSGEKLPTGVERFKTVDIFKGQKSDLLQIDSSLIKGTLSKTNEGFKFFKTTPPENVDVKSFFIGTTDSAKFYGLIYTPKDFILKGTKASSKFTALSESRSILPTTAESFRLYPPALPSPRFTPVTSSAVFTLDSISKAQRLSNYRAFMDSFKPLTTLTPEKTSTPRFTTLEGNNFSKGFKSQIAKAERDVANTTRLEFSKTSTAPKLSKSDSNLLKPKSFDKTFLISKKQDFKLPESKKSYTPRAEMMQTQQLRLLYNKSVPKQYPKLKISERLAPRTKSYETMLAKEVSKASPRLESLRGTRTKSAKYQEMEFARSPRLYFKTNIGTGFRTGVLTGVRAGYQTQAQTEKGVLSAVATIPKIGIRTVTGQRVTPGMLTGMLVGVQTQTGVNVLAQEQTYMDNIRNYQKQTFTRPVIPRFDTRPKARTGALPLPKKTKVSKNKSLTEQAFVPAVKIGSRYKEIKSNKKMNYYYAMHKGAKIVDNTTARNFKLKPVSGKPTLFKMNAPNNISKFYKPSKTQKEYFRGAYIEKSRHAIDTLGERQGLSVARYLKKV